MPESKITKRKVTMRSVVLNPTSGEPETHEAVDYVPDDERGLLEPYLADARTRWQFVTVSDEPDAGPGGYEGQTAVPADIDSPLAGRVFAATSTEEN